MVPSTSTPNKGVDQTHKQLPSSAHSKPSSLSMLHIPICYSPVQSQAASIVPVPSAPPGRQHPTLRPAALPVRLCLGEERAQSLFASEIVFVQVPYSSQTPTLESLWATLGGTRWALQGRAGTTSGEQRLLSIKWCSQALGGIVPSLLHPWPWPAGPLSISCAMQMIQPS